MKKMILVQTLAVILLSQQCISQPLQEPVVSVYTTQATTMGTKPSLDVYHQIASNIAERITAPLFTFLGVQKNNSKQATTPTTTQSKVELQNQELLNGNGLRTVDNDISKDRDVEELSVEGLQKNQKKPEKITLYSSYLPVLEKASEVIEARNDTWNELDDPFNWDSGEDVPAKPRQGAFIYILELFGSIIQLLWGGIMALFRPNSGKSSL